MEYQLAVKVMKNGYNAVSILKGRVKILELYQPPGMNGKETVELAKRIVALLPVDEPVTFPTPVLD